MPLPDSALPFMHIRKRHVMQQTPYSLVDLYLPKALYDRLPAEADRHRLYTRLLRHHTEMTRFEGHQTITIALTTQEQAELLGITLASPLARVDSRLVADDGQQVLAHRALIRGDLFVAHRRTGDILSADPIGWSPTALHDAASDRKN